MHRSILLRLLLGAAAISPLAVVGLVLAGALGFRLRSIDVGTVVLIFVVVSLVLYAISLGYFLYLVATETALDSADKARWTYLLLLFFPFGTIAFWYRYVWRERREGDRRKGS